MYVLTLTRKSTQTREGFSCYFLARSRAVQAIRRDNTAVAEITGPDGLSERLTIETLNENAADAEEYMDRAREGME